MAGNGVSVNRACDGCTLCCKLFHVPVLQKQAGTWCRHCSPGTGCAIHGERPGHCREFFCQWIKNDTLPDYWKPDRSRIILTLFPDNGFLYAQVDPARADAWRQAKLLADLQRWARLFLKDRKHVVVFVESNATLILPDQIVPLGLMRPGEGFRLKPVFRDGRRSFEVERAGAVSTSQSIPQPQLIGG